MSDDTVHLEDVFIERNNLVFSSEELRFEASGRRVRVLVDGVVVADSDHMMLLTEAHRMPVYYFPTADVRADLIRDIDRTRPDDVKGVQRLFDLEVGDRRIATAGWTHAEVGSSGADLRGYTAFYWRRMDAWYEEDEQIYHHPRDPYHRVDTMPSSRSVEVDLLGATIASSPRPLALFETTLPTRFYLPHWDVRMDMLVPSETRSQCPYKGVAKHWSVRVGNSIVHDVAWTYEFPIPECPKITNLICFYDERVDEVRIDGRRRDVPTTPWSAKRRITPVKDAASPDAAKAQN